ncbi:VWA domain-containing protein [Flexivirga sp. ID2601S]|uniref:VWA domain-containing protein n=1 Tax=Flexivirga aerilata TaxID=1656889 RepID=A0A849AP95_9MICO|nr:VWA domain-containing protein [Flexivirga aerilata]NNG40140.1 VWA domain-containing protein [Flexivirga aerilata]
MRAHGMRVGTSEVTDAARVAQALGLDDRERLRAGVAAAMLRRSDDRSSFDQLFDIYFPAAAGRRMTGAAGGAEDADALRDRLARALAAGDTAAAEQLAAAAVELLGRVGDDAAGWSAARTLDALAPQRAISAAQDLLRGDAPGEGAGSGPGSGQGAGGMAAASPQGATTDTDWAINPWDREPGRPERFTDRIDRDELRARVEAFRRQVESESRRRNAEVRDREQVARLAIPRTIRQRDFLTAGSDQLHQLRRELDPLARKLAARLTSRERAGRGAIDVRRTLRASMSTGGVPIDPVYQRRAPHRPDLVLLADLSGSVGGFSGFTMLLMQALHQHFRKVRIFGFVSSTAEITDVVHDLPPGTSLTSWALGTPELIARGTNSNYGWALRTFVRGHLDALGRRSTVLVLGDARNNFADPGIADLQRIADRARHLTWLNPEPEVLWRQGDSAAQVYGRIAPMHECRNLEQLRDFVARTLPI